MMDAMPIKRYTPEYVVWIVVVVAAICLFIK